MRVRGVLALQPRQPRWLLIPEQRQQLDTFAAQIAIALERVHYVEVAQQRGGGDGVGAAAQCPAGGDLARRAHAADGADRHWPRSLQRVSRALGAAAADMAANLGEQALRMIDLVTNLLDMARLQSGAVSLRLEWQSVEEVVGGAVPVCRTQLGGQRALSVRIDRRPAAGGVRCRADRARAGQPAGKRRQVHARADHQCEIWCTDVDDEVLVSVRDHGPGCRAGPGGSRCSRSSRAATPKSATPGVGLGLAICKAIVDAHRGSISAGQSPGEGREFTLQPAAGTPPVIDLTDDAPPAREKPQPDVHPDTRRPGGRRRTADPALRARRAGGRRLAGARGRHAAGRA